MSNPLTDIIPAAVRRPLYVTYALTGLSLGAVQVGFSSAGEGQPVWLTVALSVYAFIGTGFGFTASANVPEDESAD